LLDDVCDQRVDALRVAATEPGDDLSRDVGSGNDPGADSVIEIMVQVRDTVCDLDDMSFKGTGK
jgi:hypothetical protein